MTLSGCNGLKPETIRTTSHAQVAGSSEDRDGGRYWIRTSDFHRVKMALYR
jgi:hypothetical protein